MGEEASDRVGRGIGRRGHDDPDRPGRELVGEGQTGCEKRQGTDRRQKVKRADLGIQSSRVFDGSNSRSHSACSVGFLFFDRNNRQHQRKL